MSRLWSNAPDLAKARAVRIEDELARRGYPFWTRPRHNNLGQPCPACGGTDRFSINIKKQLWNCRACGCGGDVIALVRHLDGLSFWEAVRLLTGHAPPQKPLGGQSEPAGSWTAIKKQPASLLATLETINQDCKASMKRCAAALT